MKKKLIAILLIVSVVGIVADQFIGFGLRHNLNIKSQYVQNGGIDAQVLFHGPCEPLFTIDPNYLGPLIRKSVYNLSLDHSDFSDNFLHLYLYLKNNRKPEHLFLYVTPESFDINWNTFHTYRFLPDLSDSVVAEIIHEKDEVISQLSPVPLLRYTYYGRKTLFNSIQGWGHYFREKKDPYHKSGHQPHLPQPLTYDQGYLEPSDLVWENHMENSGAPGAEFLEQYEANTEFIWDVNREKNFRRILKFCSDNDINLTLYESPTYKEVTNGQVNRKEIISKIKMIANDYGVDYQVFDYLPISYDKQNFVSPLITDVKASKKFMIHFSEYYRKKK